MKKPLLLAVLLVLLSGAILGGCAKKKETEAVAAAPSPAQPQPAQPAQPAPPPPPKRDSVELVDAPGRSQYFTAVQRQLELGGTVYGYVDVDGDIYKVADSLKAIADQVALAQPAAAPFVKQDFRALFTDLGLADFKAVGLSSVPEGDGYFRNRVFFLTPQGRHGLLAGLGGKPAPFAKLKLAPADADFYSEAEVDLAEVYKTVKGVVARVGGETSANLMEEKIKQAGEAATISLLSFFNDWKGHTAMVLRLHPQQNMMLPGVVIPQPSLLVCADGLASTVEPMLKKSPMLKVQVEGDRRTYSLARPLPLPGLDPVFVLDGSTFYFATSRAFMDECLSQKSTLEQNPAFQQALTHVGNEGNGLAYVSPKFFTRLQDLTRLNPNLSEDKKRLLQMVLNNLPKPSQPLVSVRTNLPDGILVRAHWNRSLKQDVAMIAVYNPVTIGFLAAMAIPAFEKVRHSSQEKAITNNLRQLAAAADQYYLEHGVESTTFDQLVGPDKYVSRITPVAGEEYQDLKFRMNRALAVQTADGREIRFPPDLPLPEDDEEVAPGPEASEAGEHPLAEPVPVLKE